MEDFSMTLDDLILRIKNVSFESAVCQTEIKTDEDKQRYNAEGYSVEYTEDEFKEKFEIDTSCVWYLPSITNSHIYFNEETLAVTSLNLLYSTLAQMDGSIKSAYNAVKQAEQEVSEGDYFRSLMYLPDGMTMEYFRLLVDSGRTINDLYNLFLSFYTKSDYGFGSADYDTISKIFKAKTPAQKRKTTLLLKTYPDVITIFRGENSASTSYTEAFSWTTDINTANFFACKNGIGPARIVKGEVSKKDVIEYFERNGEKEIITFPDKVKIVEVTNLEDYEYLKVHLLKVNLMYQKYREKLWDLDYTHDNGQHGKEHAGRVLIMTLLLADKLGLPMSDRKVLATAAIYHDAKRTNDGVDDVHGKDSREYYESDVVKPDPLVSFLCEYHCKPTAEGYEEIKRNRKLSKNRTRAKLLFDLFKDADNLDRVRFGIHDLDLNKLRTDAAKTMTLVAELHRKQLRVK